MNSPDLQALSLLRVRIPEVAELKAALARLLVL
jgi:hypothetical protein